MEKIIIVATLILFVILCFIVASVWERKGLSYGKGFALSFFFTPLMGALLGILETMSDTKSSLGSKMCPQCREYIKIEASICKFCGHNLDINYLKLAEKYEEKKMIPEAIMMHEQYLKINRFFSKNCSYPQK